MVKGRNFRPKSLFFVKPSLNTPFTRARQGLPAILLINLPLDQKVSD